MPPRLSDLLREACVEVVGQEPDGRPVILMPPDGCDCDVPHVTLVGEAEAMFWRQYAASSAPMEVVDLPGYLVMRRLAKSKGQAKRLLLQGAVRINGQAVTAMEWEGDPHMLRYIWVAGHESTKARETQR